jgi:hypothetical protein
VLRLAAPHSGALGRTRDLAVRAKPRFLSKRKSKNASPDFRPKQESEDDMDSIEIGGTEMDGGYRREAVVCRN